jgi:hypothetical protein
MNKRGADLVRFYRLIAELEALNGGLQRLATAKPVIRVPASASSG